MLMVAIDRLRKMIPGCQFQVLGHTTATSKELPGVDPVDHLAKKAVFGRHAVLGRVGKKLRIEDSFFSSRWPITSARLIAAKAAVVGNKRYRMRSFIQKLQTADLVFSSGGGFVNDRFPDHGFDALALLSGAQSLGIPTAMLGQGIGPLEEGPLRRLAGRTLSGLKLLGLRESGESLKLVNELGVPQETVRVTGDDAIEIAYRERPDTLGDRLGLNIRVAAYADLDDSDVKRVRDAVGSALERLRARPMIVPIAIAPGGDEDRTRELIPEPLRETATPATEPLDVIQRAGRCRLVITGSYHAGVFALSQGVPVIGLAASDYYQAKFQGLRRQFGPACEVIDPRGEGLNERLGDLAERLWNEASVRRNETLAAAEVQIALSREAYREVASLLTGATV